MKMSALPLRPETTSYDILLVAIASIRFCQFTHSHVRYFGLFALSHKTPSLAF